MAHFLGEFECKLDAKGRMVLPAGLKKQIPEVEREGLVINRGLESHLVIYPRREWDRIMEELSKLNTFERKTRDFVRKFMRGATELSLDSANRVLIPKSLLEYASIDGEVVLASQFNKIEVWAKETYDAQWEDEGDDFASLAEEVMGNLNRRVDG
ncbi:division/cell wall cluster transcriptional repressor MraZ [Olivibacter ginsenosidimutans]|uniref:Transcriptional regulator MraZ n=1 Tax=Olivibacter ginsenosidimutans TaxID=1176537 RepID=A0ABP9BW86_9SPHI